MVAVSGNPQEKEKCGPFSDIEERLRQSFQYIYVEFGT
jgi:hypothetical protein